MKILPLCLLGDFEQQCLRQRENAKASMAQSGAHQGHTSVETQATNQLDVGQPQNDADQYFVDLTELSSIAHVHKGIAMGFVENLYCMYNRDFHLVRE